MQNGDGGRPEAFKVSVIERPPKSDGLGAPFL